MLEEDPVDSEAVEEAESTAIACRDPIERSRASGQTQRTGRDKEATPAKPRESTVAGVQNGEREFRSVDGASPVVFHVFDLALSFQLD